MSFQNFLERGEGGLPLDLIACSLQKSHTVFLLHIFKKLDKVLFDDKLNVSHFQNILVAMLYQILK